MNRNKPRLYIVFLRHQGEYRRAVNPINSFMANGADEFRWGLLAGPKDDKNSFVLYRLARASHVRLLPIRPDSFDSARTIVPPPIDENVVPYTQELYDCTIEFKEALLKDAKFKSIELIQRKLEVIADLSQAGLTSCTPIIRIAIGKIEQVNKLHNIILSTRDKIPQVADRDAQEPSVRWVKLVLDELRADKKNAKASLGTAELDWDKIQSFAVDAPLQRARVMKDMVTRFSHVTTYSLIDG